MHMVIHAHMVIDAHMGSRIGGKQGAKVLRMAKHSMALLTTAFLTMALRTMALWSYAASIAHR